MRERKLSIRIYLFHPTRLEQCKLRGIPPWKVCPIGASEDKGKSDTCSFKEQRASMWQGLLLWLQGSKVPPLSTQMSDSFPVDIYQGTGQKELSSPSSCTSPQLHFFSRGLYLSQEAETDLLHSLYLEQSTNMAKFWETRSDSINLFSANSPQEEGHCHFSYSVAHQIISVLVPALLRQQWFAPNTLSTFKPSSFFKYTWVWAAWASRSKPYSKQAHFFEQKHFK